MALDYPYWLKEIPNEQDRINNGFIFSTLTTLLEYDVPMSAINKLQDSFKNDEPFESIYNKLKEINLVLCQL